MKLTIYMDLSVLTHFWRAASMTSRPRARELALASSRSLLAFRSRSICFVRGRLVASLKLYLPDAVLEFKCINGIVPTYLSVHFYRGRLRSGRTTRQSNDRLTVTSLNSELLRVKKSFVYRASNIWNSLCPERKYCMSSFRRIFRHELIYAQY
jgi:hypothetical protein